MVRGFIEKLVQKLEDRGAVPPGTLDEMNQQMEKAIQEEGTIGGILRSLVYALILYPIFSMLGALIGYGMYGKKKSSTQPPIQT
jgi:hypothetical protein